MTEGPRIVAVGTPQMFKHQVANAADLDVETIEWVASVTSAVDVITDEGEPVDVLVLSPEVKDADAVGFAETVATLSPTSAIVMVRDKTWNGTLISAVRAGIRDVVDLTEGTDELREAMGRALLWSENLREAGRSRAETNRGTIISVFSSKGGTGKTFLTTNLATAIAQISGQDTAVLDLDIDMGDVFSYFGDEPQSHIQDLIALGDGADREMILGAATRLGDHLWGYGAPPDPAAELIAGGQVGKFLRAIRGNFPFTVIDATADYSDIALAAFDLSDAVCLITGLDVVGIKHLSKALETLLLIGLPRERFHVVLNRADSKVGLGSADVERVMKLQVDAMIPSSVLVPMSLNKGVPVFLDEPRSDVSLALGKLARKFVIEAGYEPVAGESGPVSGDDSRASDGKRRLRLGWK